VHGDIVPAEVLVPPETHGRGFRHDDAALVIDGYLRRLTAQDAHCRAVLGRLARAFLRRRGQHVLGFARLGDYARERLGRSARELQSLAAVTERLEALSAIRDAFEGGEISWTQVRLLVAVATPETERAWLELARGRTVRALAAVIRAAGRSDAHEDEEDGDAEPRVRFRLRCPRRVARLWQETVELARRMAGAELTQGQAAEAIAAEGLSAQPPSAETWPEPPPRPDAPPGPEETVASFAPDLDWDAVREAIPAEVESLAIGCEGLDPFALDARMRAVVHARQRIDWQTGRLLRVFLDRRLYRLMGFSSAGRYLAERLGSSTRKARALVALERKSWQAPAFGEAYRAGDLSWVRALTVSPIVTEDTAAAWVSRAQEVTVRRLSDEVEWALCGRDGLAPVAPPTSRGDARPVANVCAPRLGADRLRDHLHSARLGRDALPDGDPRFHGPNGVVLDWVRAPLAPCPGRVDGTAPPSRPRLRTRRVAVCSPRVQQPAEPARPSHPLPLPRR